MKLGKYEIRITKQMSHLYGGFTGDHTHKWEDDRIAANDGRRLVSVSHCVCGATLKQVTTEDKDGETTREYVTERTGREWRAQ